MGLFGKKKTCALCGGKVGLLGSKLAGDQYLCSDCRSGCTPGANLDFSSMTPEDVQANIDIAKANQKKGRKKFQSTLQFFTGGDHDKLVISVDEKHGWFMNSQKDDGWVYNLDDITYYNMRLSTSKLEEEEKKGFFEWLFSPDFYSAYPELPQCPYDEKIIGAYLTLRLAENELGLDEVEFDVFPGFFTDENDVRGAYECCHAFYEFMHEYHTNQNSEHNTAPVQTSSSDTDIAETLTKLHGLVQTGILTQEEFDAKKKQLLGL